MSSFLDLNDNCVTLNSLLNKITNTFVNDAVVTVTVRDIDDVILVNAQAMPYVVSSDGVYRTVILSTVDLGDDGDTVTVQVSAVAGDGSVFNTEPELAYIRGRKLSGL